MRTRSTIALLCAASAVFAQERLPEFEVATVKVSPERTPEQMAAIVMRRGPVYFDWPRISILELVMFAYEIDGTRVIVPDALMKERFDVSAKAPEPVDEHQRNLMLRSLLLDRFQLAVRRETRTLPIYELTVAKSGLKMIDSTLGKPDDPRASPLPEQKEGGSLWIEPGKAQLKRYTRSEDGVTLSAGRRQRMSDIEFLITRTLRDGRIAVDKTGLTGTYDFGVQFLDPAFEIRNPAKASKDVPGIFAAFEQYLGLRLDARNGPVEVVVVDSANLEPGEN